MILNSTTNRHSKSLHHRIINYFIKLKFFYLFNVREEEINFRKILKISIFIHIFLFIVAIFPYEYFIPSKTIKLNDISVQIMPSVKYAAYIEKENKNENIEEINESSAIQTDKIAEKKPEEVKIENKEIIPINKNENIQNNKIPVVDKKIQKIEPKKTNKLPKEIKKIPVKKIDTIDHESKIKAQNIIETKTIEDNTQDVEAISTLNEIKNIESINDKKTISAQLHTCWTATQINTKMSSDISVTVVINYNPNGSMQSYNIENKRYRTSEKMIGYNIAKNNVKIALNNCSYIKNLNQKNYNSWKQIRVNFKYSKVEF